MTTNLWILTATGRDFPLSGLPTVMPDAEPQIEDIAHALAQINRYTGHAARLLRETAEELRQAHAYNNSEGWENETDAKDAYDEHLAAAQALEDWEAAVGAGGVEPLCKQVAPQTQAAPDERAAFEKWLRVKPCGAAHDFGWEAWRARAALAATYPTQQGLELANCKGGKWLTVVYRDISPDDEARLLAEHPKASAMSWSHALHDRDAALAAKAKQGEQP